MIPCLRSVWSSVWLVEDKQGEEATRDAFKSEVAIKLPMYLNQGMCPSSLGGPFGVLLKKVQLKDMPLLGTFCLAYKRPYGVSSSPHRFVTYPLMSPSDLAWEEVENTFLHKPSDTDTLTTAGSASLRSALAYRHWTGHWPEFP